MVSNKPIQNCGDLCKRAEDMTLKAGFELGHISKQTETRYYRWPGQYGFLRVSTHSNTIGNLGVEPIRSKITFNGNWHVKKGFIKISDEKVESMVAAGIGRYFLNNISASGRLR